MNKPKIFELEIKRYNPNGNNTFAEVSLPATPYELIDALEKACITSEQIYALEILSCELKYLPQRISDDVNLYELNHLANRLSSLNTWELDCFEGMVMMDTVKNKNAPISIARLINMTYSTENCQVVYEAHDDASLGKFYADNGFVEALDTMPERLLPWLDYSIIGKEMRESENGVFTHSGYVVQNGEIVQKYKSGDAVTVDEPEYTILLRVTNECVSNTIQNSIPTALLKLPADDTELYQAVNAAGASYPEEFSFIPVDCIVPSLMEKIGNSIYQTEGDSYGLVNELAQQIQHLSDKGNLLIYKAMMNEVSEDITLEDILDLSYKVDNFSVIREATTPAEYARHILSKYCIECEKDLFESADLYNYGNKLMKEKGAVLTEYGVLWSLTGQTMEQCLNRSEQNKDMEMK